MGKKLRYRCYNCKVFIGLFVNLIKRFKLMYLSQFMRPFRSHSLILLFNFTSGFISGVLCCVSLPLCLSLTHTHTFTHVHKFSLCLRHTHALSQHTQTQYHIFYPLGNLEGVLTYTLRRKNIF